MWVIYNFCLINIQCLCSIFCVSAIPADSCNKLWSLVLCCTSCFLRYICFVPLLIFRAFQPLKLYQLLKSSSKTITLISQTINFVLKKSLPDSDDLLHSGLVAFYTWFTAPILKYTFKIILGVYLPSFMLIFCFLYSTLPSFSWFITLVSIESIFQ